VAGIEDYLEPDVNGVALGGSVATIGRQIAEALQRRDLLEMARRGQALAVRRYGWSRTVRRMEAVYASALGSRRHVTSAPVPGRSRLLEALPPKPGRRTV
jgi:hypothetical protein